MIELERIHIAAADVLLVALVNVLGRIHLIQLSIGVHSNVPAVCQRGELFIAGLGLVNTLTPKQSRQQGIRLDLRGSFGDSLCLYSNRLNGNRRRSRGRLFCLSACIGGHRLRLHSPGGLSAAGNVYRSAQSAQGRADGSIVKGLPEVKCGRLVIGGALQYRLENVFHKFLASLTQRRSRQASGGSLGQLGHSLYGCILSKPVYQLPGQLISHALAKHFPERSGHIGDFLCCRRQCRRPQAVCQLISKIGA